MAPLKEQLILHAADQDASSANASLRESESDDLRMYYNEISRFPLLKPQEERNYAIAIRKGQVAFELLKELKKKTQGDFPSILEAFIDDNSDRSVFAYSNFNPKSGTHVIKNKLGFVRAENQPKLLGLAQGAIQAHEDLVNSNLRLAVSIAKRHSANNLSMLDRIQAGNNGLLKAAAKYNFRFGFRFSTFATWWIRQTVSREIQDTDNLIRYPIHIQELGGKIRRLQEKLLAENGSYTATQIQDALDVTPAQYKGVIKNAHPVVSLSQPVNEDGDISLADTISSGDSDDVEKAAEDNILRGQLDQIKSAVLGTREKFVLDLRFGSFDGRPRTLEEIGKELSVTRERARQIEAIAIRKLSYYYHTHSNGTHQS